MKALPHILFIFLLVSCENSNSEIQSLHIKIDSLQSQLDKTYKPGLGEFMSGIQVHHSKLWFAGEAQNWALADFEMNEIKEALDGIMEFNTDRLEAKSIPMIFPVMDSLAIAIQEKNPQSFERNYNLLTNTCNNCHRATHHEFNVIKTPDTPPFSNQVFKTL